MRIFYEKKEELKVTAQFLSKLVYLPAIITFGIFFIIPTLASFYYSLTRWTIFDATYIGLENYKAFLSDPMLSIGLKNTFIYAILTSGLKTV